MKIVVIGGTGLIGSKLVPKLIEHGHDAVAASPDTGVNTLSGQGLKEVLYNANVVVDVTNSPSLDGDDAMSFFTTSTRNLISYGLEAGVLHHVVLSVVGTGRLSDSGYFRAKIAQERLIRESLMPYSIVHATQFFEFAKTMANAGDDGEHVRVAPVLIQPMAADDVASAVGRVASREPLIDRTEVAGPEVLRLDDFIRRSLAAAGDPRAVVADPAAHYFGASLSERTLLPDAHAHLSEVRLGTWLANADLPASAGRR